MKALEPVIYLDSATGDLHAEVKRVDRLKDRLTYDGSAKKGGRA
jgi:hypothetical protein